MIPPIPASRYRRRNRVHLWSVAGSVTISLMVTAVTG